MKKLFLTCSVFCSILVSCESEQDELESNTNLESQTEELITTQFLLDGEELTIYTDIGGEEPLIIQNEDYLKFEEITSGRDLTYYVDPNFEGYAVFSSSEKLNATLSSEKELQSFNSKMLGLNGYSKSKGTSTTSATARSLPKFTIAYDLGLKGTTFSRSNFTTYANPHLRCNQYETGCKNFNDKITSIEVVNAVAEFYEGSFRGKGNRLYVNALGDRRAYIGTLKDYRLQFTEFSGSTFVRGDNTCRVWTSPFCRSWNDKITSFWVSSTMRASGNDPGSFLSQDCSHNFRDPACNGSGGSGGGSGGSGGSGEGGGGGPTEIVPIL